MGTIGSCFGCTVVHPVVNNERSHRPRDRATVRKNQKSKCRENYEWRRCIVGTTTTTGGIHQIQPHTNRSGITRNPASPKELIPIVLDILLHFSFSKKNAHLLLEQDAVECLDKAALTNDSDYVPTVLCIIANLCESTEMHDAIMESRYFFILQQNVFSDATAVQQHLIRAFLHLSLSPRYHHVILATGLLSNMMSIAMTERLHYSIRMNAVQILAAVSATHPTTPTEQDIMDLVFLACNLEEDIEIRRYCMLTLANAASDAANTASCMKRAYLEAILAVVDRGQSTQGKDPSEQLAEAGRISDAALHGESAVDAIFVDFATQFFHNLAKVDDKTGLMLLQCGFEKHYLDRGFLKKLSVGGRAGAGGREVCFLA